MDSATGGGRFGTVARYRLREGMEARLLEFERVVQAARLPGLVAAYTFRIEAEPGIYYEAAVFESREAYRALASSPEQTARFKRLLELLVDEPEWHDGEVL